MQAQAALKYTALDIRHNGGDERGKRSLVA